jgi:hypothetical protein
MWGRFPLTKVVIRVLEIAGAGLTSAVVAYLLGRTEPPPPAPAPAVVQLAPSDQEMIRTVHSDQAALLDQLRSEADARKKMQVASQATSQQATSQQATPQVAAPETSPQQTALQATMPQAATPQAAPQQATPPQPLLTNEVAVSATDLAVASAPAAKPEKSAQASTRREQKPERVRAIDSKPEAKSESNKTEANKTEANKTEANKTEANKTEAKPRLKVAPRGDEVPHSRPMPGVVVEAVARNASQREVVAAPVLVAPPPPPVASAPPPENDGVLSSTLRGITAWILPSRDRVPMPDQNAARPPKAVGEFQSSM